MRIIIIGAGPGGYETALEAAAEGQEVILVEKRELGGTCLNEGCIPTKSFCRSAEVLSEMREAASFGVSAAVEARADMSAIVGRKNSIVAQLREGIASMLAAAKVQLVQGTATLLDSNSVKVVSADGTESVLSADRIILATGSHSASLPVPGADLPGIATSTEMLDLQEVPERLCIIGGGVIGLELASVYNAFGSKVTVVEFCKEILPRFDADLAKRLRTSLSRKGIDILVGAGVTSIAHEGETWTVSYSRKGKDEAVEADLVLMAVGRRPNIEGLGLAEAGVEYGPRGVVVDSNFQTSLPGVYAIGDITGGYMLAHTATAQGRVALAHILGRESNIRLDVMPAAVFTVPEAACVGRSEEELKAAEVPYKAYKSFFRANGKALCLGESDGICKVLASEDGNILGAHIMGAHASDLIEEIALVMSSDGTIDDIRKTVHPHPAVCEVIATAVSR